MTTKNERRKARMREYCPETSIGLLAIKHDLCVWLHQHASMVYDPTNPYEVLRFDAKHGVAVIYQKANGCLTWSKDAAEMWDAYARNDPNWRPFDKTKRGNGGKRQRQMRAVAHRDGWQCVYCGCVLTRETATIEHIIPLSQGGADKPENIALACEEHNRMMDNLPAAQKLIKARKMWEDPHKG